MALFREVTLVPLGVAKDEVRAAAQVRSTLVAASIQALRQRGLIDRWRASLTQEWQEQLIAAPAGTWLPIEHGEAHYAACDKLGLDDDTVLGMGNAVATLTQKTVFSLAARVVREAGASPLTVVDLLPRLWGRLFTGGAVAAFQIGPKDVRFETYGISLARYRYFRVGYRGIMLAIVSPFCRSLFVRELPERTGPSTITMKMSWV